MQFVTRPYGGKLFRPEPEVHISDDHNLIIIATPWGNPEIAKDFISLFLNHWRDARQDQEKTTSFMPDDSLSYSEHLFKMSVLATHEDLKDKYNEGELSAGAEILCLFKNQEKISWFQVGSPSLILARGNSLLPLFHNVDFSFDFSTPENSLAPLPKNLVGLQQQVNLSVGSLRSQKGDRFLMVSRCSIPYSFFQAISTDTLDLDTVTRLFAEDNENQPFWLGLLTIT